MTTTKLVVNGVNLGAAKLPLVDAALAKKGLAIGGTDQQKIARLAAWYQQHTPKTRLADCSTCGGESDVEEPACPFCGDGETDEKPAPVAAAGTSGKVSTPTPTPPAQALVRYPVPAAVVIPSPSPRLALAATEASLDDAVANIGLLMQSAADRFWELGSAIVDVFNATLWTHRRDEQGHAKYKSWGQFCEAELGISHGYSLKLMDVAREFTREQVRQIGASKLHITLAVPKGPAREKLLGLAPSTTKADLTRIAKEEAVEPRSTGRGKKGGAGTHKGGPAKSGGRKPEKITVAMLTARVELHPTNTKNAKVRLKIPGAPLVAEERLFNGVKQRIVVTNDEDGYLLVVVERVRE